MIEKSAIKAVFENSLKLKISESCLIVTDERKESIAKSFFEFLEENLCKCKIVSMKALKEHGEEPPKNISKEMQQFDVLLLITSKSLTHTKARRDATKKGARIASMPMLSEDIANRCFDIDYDTQRKDSIFLAKKLRKTKNVRITTNLGTNIDLKVGDRPIFDNNGGIFNFSGAFGNLPEGEVEFSPTNANGTYVVDASFPTFGKLNSPLTFIVKDGFVVEIKGEKSEELKSKLDKLGKKAYLVAELGIGMNKKAKVIGNVLEDEKVFGTCHIAIGNNLSYSGTNDVAVHLDGVITKPTIYFDEEKVMQDGNFLI